MNPACSEGKAIWVIAGNDTTIENVEFSGASVPDQNGAGIRQEGANLVIEHCYFHDNQEGILAADNPASSIVIDSSEFAHKRRRRRFLAQHLHQPRPQLHAALQLLDRRAGRAPGQVTRGTIAGAFGS